VKVNKQIKIGLVVVAGIATFLFGINFLKGKSFFGEQRKLYAIYGKVDGLGKANPILLNGVKIGQVSNVTLTGKYGDRIIVELYISNNEIAIPKNSTARIISADLLGSKAITLLPGDSQVNAMPGDTLMSTIEEGLKEAVNEQIAPLKMKAEGLIGGLDSVVTVFQTILNKDAIGDINASFSSIRKTLESLDGAAASLEDVITTEKIALKEIIENFNKISANLATGSENIDALLVNMKGITDSLNNANLKATVNSLGGTLAELDKALTAVNTQQGSLGKLVYSDQLINGMNAAIKDLEFLLEDLKANPKRYVNFSVFGGRTKGVDLTKSEEEKLKYILKNEQ